MAQAQTRGATVWGTGALNSKQIISPVPTFWGAGLSYEGLMRARKNDTVSAGLDSHHGEQVRSSRKHRRTIGSELSVDSFPLSDHHSACSIFVEARKRQSSKRNRPRNPDFAYALILQGSFHLVAKAAILTTDFYFVSGHDFSRAVKAQERVGFSPCVRKLFQPLRFSIRISFRLYSGRG